jgi:hypothetical protein
MSLIKDYNNRENELKFIKRLAFHKFLVQEIFMEIFNYVKENKDFLSINRLKIESIGLNRILNHDYSKLNKDTLEGYILSYKKFEEKKELTKEENDLFEKAWKIHKNTEDHHKLHLDKTITDENILLEVFCDWFAMSLEKTDLDLEKAKKDFYNYCNNVFFKDQKNDVAIEFFDKILKNIF